jgi:hypothetical protein
MKTGKGILIISLALLIFRCGKENPATGSLETVFLDFEHSHEIAIEDFWAKAKAAELELTEESAIDRVNKIVFDEGLFYLFHEIDLSRARNILIFDETGKFVKKIASDQPGPGAFTYMRDFIISDEGMIELLDPLRKKIIRYSREGAFQNDQRMDVSAIKFTGFKEGRYLLYRGNSTRADSYFPTRNLLFIDSEGRIKDVPRAPVNELFEDLQVLAGEFFFPARQPGVFLFSDIFNDTIYECTSERVTPKFLLKYANETYRAKRIARLAEEKLKKAGNNYSYSVLELLNDSEIVAKPELISSCEDFLLFSFRYHRKRYFLRYDPFTRTGKMFHLSEMPLWPLWHGGQKSIIMVVTNPAGLKKQFMRKNHSGPDHLYHVFERITENSNPVVLQVNIDELFK